MAWTRLRWPLCGLGTFYSSVVIGLWLRDISFFGVYRFTFNARAPSLGAGRMATHQLFEFKAP